MAIFGWQTSKQAVKEATKHVVKRLGRSGTKRLEIEMLHGRRSIGTISAISGTSTTRVLTISDASWSAGIWAGMENCTLDAYRTATTFSDTKINSNAKMILTVVDVANKKLTVTGNATRDPAFGLPASRTTLPVGMRSSTSHVVSVSGSSRS